MRFLLLMMTGLLLGGCSMNSKSCNEAVGARCAMLSTVDKMIDSGEIEQVYSSLFRKKCSNGKCVGSYKGELDTPEMNLLGTYEIQLEEPIPTQWKSDNKIITR